MYAYFEDKIDACKYVVTIVSYIIRFKLICYECSIWQTIQLEGLYFLKTLCHSATMSCFIKCLTTAVCVFTKDLESGL